jgi:uncharacterized protein YacL
VERLFNLDLQKRWGTFSVYEKFEHLIITLLTAIIAAIVGAATWQLILHTYDLVRSHLVDPRDSQVFQTVFGMVLTVLIAMEFKHSLLIVLHQQRAIVQIRSVVLIACLQWFASSPFSTPDTAAVVLGCGILVTPHRALARAK